MATYIGQNLTQGSRQRVSYTATAGQTTFSAGYAPGFVDVYQNGLLLPTSEYTATNGSTVVLNTGAALNDEIEIIGQFLFAVEDTVSSSSGGTFSGAVNINSNLTISGYLAGPANFTIDPAGVGDNTGTVVIAGDLQVDGTTTTINSTTLEVDDLNITLASGAADAAAANGAGITVDGAGATLTYVSAGDNWSFNKDLDIDGTITTDLIALDAIGTTEARYIKIGGGRTSDGDSYIDLISNSTYADYSARFVRWAGANQETQILHRGTGSLTLMTDDAGDIRLNTNGTERMRIKSDGKVGINTSAPETFFHVDDKDGTGPTVILEGGGTNTDTPAAGEQTLFLKTGSGTTSLSTGIGFYGTFESFPGDTSQRRAADIRAGFDGGTWGNEYISFNVGVGTGNTGNDAAAMTDERLRITKTAVIATGDIEDSVSNVRTPRFAELTGASNHNLTNEGVYVIDGSSTFSQIIIGDGATLTAGTIMTIYNNRSSSLTISRGSIPYMRNAADGDYTNRDTRTLGRNSVTTVTMFSNSLIILTGTDIS